MDALEFGVTDLVVNAVSIENPSVSLSDPAAWRALFGGSEAVAGVDITFESVMGYPPIFRAVTLIMAKVAGTPLEAIERATTQAIDDHAAFKLLGKNQESSQFMTSLQMKKSLELRAQIYGNGYAAIIRDGETPVRLRLLNSMDVYPVLIDGPGGPDDPGGRELWWGAHINGETYPIRDEDMFHIPSSVLQNGIEGMAMLDLMRNALGLPLAAQRYSSKFFANGSNLSGVLMIPGHFSNDKIQNTMKAWNTMQEGLENAHKIALLQDGVKWQPVSADPEKSQLTETRDHEIRATASNVTGVPPHLLGDPTRTSHNSLEAENSSLLDNCLRPRFDVWEAESNKKLRTRQEKRANSVVIEFNTRDLLRMDYAARVEGYRTLKEIGVLTTNDILSAENMPQIGPEGDVRHVPANWVRANSEPPPAPEQPPSEAEAMVRRVVSSRAKRSIEVEARQVVKAAKEEKNFLNWIDGFYESWPVKSASTLEEVGAVSTSFTAHADLSKQQLLDVAGSCTPATLVSSVSACVSTWDNRTDALTECILSEVK